MDLSDLSLPLSFITGSNPANATSFSASSNLLISPIFATIIDPVTCPILGMVVIICLDLENSSSMTLDMFSVSEMRRSRIPGEEGELYV